MSDARTHAEIARMIAGVLERPADPAPVYTFGGDALERRGVRVTIDGYRFDKENGSHRVRLMYVRAPRHDDAVCSRAPCTWVPRCPTCRTCRATWCGCTCERFNP